MDTFISAISGKKFPNEDKISGKSIRKSILEIIQKEHPKFSSDQFISISELNGYRESYISKILLKEVGDLTKLEQAVLTTLNKETTITDKVDEEPKNYSFGQRIADKVAEFGGSWTFIITFLAFIVLWISLNMFIYLNKGFDPYPFILLNLILSCIAALQAPVIMMSQNRQEEKDRERAKNDYMINLKSELEIRMLHEKIDHLIMHQEESLIEIQRVQIDMMNDIIERVKK